MILVVKGENRVCRFHFIWMLAASSLSLKPHNAHIRKKVMIFKSQSHVDTESMKIKISSHAQ